MTEEKAYCCLNCKASANCCGACGECLACCAECEDMSKCNSIAYVDKNGELYLKYNYNANYNSTETTFGTDDVDCDPDRSSASNFSIRLEMNSGEDPLYNGSYSFSNSRSCCGESCCNAESGGAQQSTTKTNIKNNFFETVTISTPSEDFNDDCGIETTITSNGDYVGNLGIIDGSFCPCVGCVDDEYEIMHNWGKEKGRIKTQGYGSVTFFEKVKTYNSLGQIVSNPILGTAYDPCNPIRTIHAPACHFFHP